MRATKPWTRYLPWSKTKENGLVRTVDLATDAL